MYVACVLQTCHVMSYYVVTWIISLASNLKCCGSVWPPPTYQKFNIIIIVLAHNYRRLLFRHNLSLRHHHISVMTANLPLFKIKNIPLYDTMNWRNNIGKVYSLEFFTAHHVVCCWTNMPPPQLLLRLRLFLHQCNPKPFLRSIICR
jgi:hypothetical protein